MTPPRRARRRIAGLVIPLQSESVRVATHHPLRIAGRKAMKMSDSLDVVSQDLPVSLGTSLSETLSETSKHQ